MGLLFFEIPVFLLTAGKGKIHFLVSFIVFSAVIAAALMIRGKSGVSVRPAIRFPLASSVISLIMAALFFTRWSGSGRIQTAADFFHLPAEKTCILIALFLALLSLTGIDQLLRIFIPPSRAAGDKVPGEKYIILFIALTAALTMFLNSRCSPLYPFNDWVDPNTMFTVGKGVLKGYVPYRDLYEQKGPLLVFLHTFGAAVSYKTFIGMWILELISCFAFLNVTRKIFKLFFGEKSFIAIPFIAALVYGSFPFRGGDSTEEYALPMLAYALYVGCKAFERNEMPSAKEFFLIGLTSGSIFWLKYSICGFYLGWIIPVFILSLRKKAFADLIRGFLMILAGVTVMSLPVFAYFLANSALDFLFQAYFYNNLVYYPQNDLTFSYKMRIGYYSYQRFGSPILVFTIIGILWLPVRRKWSILLSDAAAYICTFLAVYMGGRHHYYYSFIFSVFTIFGFCGLIDLLLLVPHFRETLRKYTPAFISFSLVSGLFLLCYGSINLRYLEFKQEDMFQFKMKAIIERSGIEDPTVLYYGIGDAGVNTAAGLIPGIRFFCYYNNDAMTEIADAQNECIENKCADYIISRSKWEDAHPAFDTYDYQGWIVGMADDALEYYHYFTPKDSGER